MTAIHEMITQLLLPVTSSPRDANVKGGIFRRTIYPLNLVVIAFIFLELRRGAESAPPGRRRPKKPGVNRVKRHMKPQQSHNNLP